MSVIGKTTLKQLCKVYHLVLGLATKTVFQPTCGQCVECSFAGRLCAEFKIKCKMFDVNCVGYIQ